MAAVSTSIVGSSPAADYPAQRQQVEALGALVEAPVMQDAEGIGLKNVAGRLQSVYGTDCCFEMRNDVHRKGVETRITLPIKTHLK